MICDSVSGSFNYEVAEYALLLQKTNIITEVV
jgi:hypothetical protein